jgi:hypothetical protein
MTSSVKDDHVYDVISSFHITSLSIRHIGLHYCEKLKRTNLDLRPMA